MVSTCLAVVEALHLNAGEAIDIIAAQMRAIRAHWNSVCDEAGLSHVDRNLLWGGPFLNPFAFTKLEGKASSLRLLADEIRG
jgi:serine/threonine-protein kinase HipA